MGKQFFTRKRVRRNAWVSAGCLAAATGLGALYRARFIGEDAQWVFEWAFNLFMAISALLMMFGVIMPLNVTYDYHHKGWFMEQRKQIGTHPLFSRFIIRDDDKE